MVTVINKNRIPFFINNPNLQIINLQCEQVTDMRVQGAINKIPRSIQYYASTQFNVYTLEWTPEQMIFSVNGYVHYTYNPNPQNSETWPFDAPQYLLMNIAIESSITSSFTETEMEVDYVRVYEASTLSNQAETVPVYFNAAQNFPNPFNPITTLKYDLLEDSFVDITIYDMLGNVVNNLVNRNQRRGYKSVQWNAINNQGQPVSTGLYFYTIQAGDFIQTKKMLLLK